MNHPYLFFDLDGTVSDSAEGILNSVSYALERMGIEVPPREKLFHYIGPPLIRTFSEDYHLSREEGLRAVELYREYYNVKGIYECRMYDGIDRLLRELIAGGHQLVLATCKPTVMASRVLEYLGLRDCFEMISGPELDGTRNEKHEVIEYAMQEMGIHDPNTVLMVGDRRDDVVGAAKCGIGCVGVLWGFGSEAELREAGAVKTVKHADELLFFLKK